MTTQTNALYNELIHVLIKKDWLYHAESMIKIYSEISEKAEVLFLSEISNILYNCDKNVIGFVNENGIIKYLDF